MAYFNSIRDFRKIGEEVFKMPLPGLEAQLMMAPAIRRGQIASMQLREKAVKSGVIILTYPDEKGQLNWIFIRRPRYNGVHSGQMALPGGRYEPSDASIMHTAIREMREEIGVSIASESILGQMTPLFIPPSNYLVYPFVAYLDMRPSFIADPKEVDQIIEIPVSYFFQDNAISIQNIQVQEGSFVEAPGFQFNSQTCIWGATAMIIQEVVIAFRNQNNMHSKQ